MSDSGGGLASGPVCPLPIARYPQVLLAHGGGGRLMHQLIEQMFVKGLGEPSLRASHDGALLDAGGRTLAFTTDSFVVNPLEFPGGDIGKLAVCGTVNDLAMCGARPRWLSLGFILEEGLAMETLWRVVCSLRETAREAGVAVVTGDTKVVERGKGDGIFINTAGIGVIEHGLRIGPESLRPGDAILLSGDLGRHGIAIMARREGLEFETTIESDCAPLAGLVGELLAAGIEVHCLRDLTRGGLASALVEIGASARLGLAVEEREIPVDDGVRGACELLGLDPMYVANEGRLVAFVAEHDAERALGLMQAHPQGRGAARIGRVLEGGEVVVNLTSPIGATRIVEMLSGEQLPRIC